MSDAELPDYDTQGLIAIALTRGVIDMSSRISTRRSRTAECVDRHGHPNSAIGKRGADGRRHDLACKGKPIAALSFTATNYAKLALRSDQRIRGLTDYFFNARIARVQGRAKGARLSASARRGEETLLREGEAKLRPSPSASHHLFFDSARAAARIAAGYNRANPYTKRTQPGIVNFRCAQKVNSMIARTARM